ncbi:nitrogen fixation protein FixI [Alsobacter metallidurans]|uniref:Nitrogen fixation protein FixI n=1 Tax=Alsobacter metallidurans TaxID=340221 RepID=A0A917IBC5_9HYPH|nr:heavy metal translocating P-type ATPase [Alsobacter metallidurans]GGH28812.1 nitrogen fixation protein FixI [Alsobacter metallidurans]
MSPAFDYSALVETRPDGVRHLDLVIEGITCAACIGDIERGLACLPELEKARLNYTNRRLAAEWRVADFDPMRVISRLAELGYKAHPFEPSREEEIEAAEMRFLLRCLAVAGFAAMNIMLLSVSVWSGNASDITEETRDFFHWISALIALPTAAYAGQPFFRNAFRAIRARSMTMDVPISLGVTLALGMSLYETIHHAHHAYFDSAVMLLFFLLLGRVLDQVMRRKTRAVAGNLLALRGETAVVLGDGGAAREVPLKAVRPGDRVLVLPGDRVSVDGIVLDGSSSVDASLVTGETAHAPVGPGALVYAGAVNLDGALTVQVTAAAEGTLLDEVNRLVETAANARSRYLRLADRAARIYSPIVHVTALATAIGWMLLGAGLHDALITAIAVLIITCPCALALAVPATQVVASGSLFRAGVLLQTGDAIERMAACDTIVFDKTGTLTTPEPRVVNAGEIAPDLLEAACRLALSSRHPLAAALAGQALGRSPFPGAREEAGHGVVAQLGPEPGAIEARLGSPTFCGAEAQATAALAGAPDATVIAVRVGERRAVMLMHQVLRPDAAAVVADLRRRGFRIAILSGDREQPVADAAQALGVDEWRSGLKPGGKIDALAAMAAQGRRVLMVGDGLNDAPALAAAHASISPVTAAHLAQSSADALFLGERLRPVADAVVLARTAHAVMRQNLGIAVVYNLIAVPLAIMGHVTPLIAAAAMSGSSIIVTLNALRARLPGREPEQGSPVSATPTRPFVSTQRPARAAP